MSRIAKALSRIEMKAVDRPPAGPISAEELEVFGLCRPRRSNEAGLASLQPVAVEYHPPTGPTIDEIVARMDSQSVNEWSTNHCRGTEWYSVRLPATDGRNTIPSYHGYSCFGPNEPSAEATTEQLAQMPPSLSAEDATRQLAQTPLDLSAEASTERLAEMTLESSLDNLAELIQIQDESNAEQDETRLDEARVRDDQYDDEEDVGTRPDNVDPLLAQIDTRQESVLVEWITAIGSTEVEAVYTTETFDNVLVVERFLVADAAELDGEPASRLESNPPEASAATEPTNEALVKPAESLAGEAHDPARASTIECAAAADAFTKAEVELLEPTGATVESPVDSAVASTIDGPVNSAIEPSPPESRCDGPPVGPLLSVRRTSVGETDPHLKSLAENILYQMPARSAVVMFTSSADGEGTSDTLGQVATALAPRLGGEILVVDCNFHNPRAAKFFDLRPEHDLVQVLSGKIGWAQAVGKTRVEHLSVLAGGKFPTPDGLPPHEADLAMLLTELRHHYRLVLLDTASLSHGEVGALSRLCDAVYLVIRLGETSRQTAQQAARLLQNAGGKLRGCVLSNLPVE